MPTMTDFAPRLGFAHGLKSLPAAFGILLRTPRILLWLMPPLLITLLLDGLAFYFAFDWLRTEINSLVSGSGYSAWLRTILDLLGAVVVVFVLDWSFAWLFLTLASPFQDSISAAVERARRGFAGPEPAGFAGFFRSMFQSAVQALALSSLTVLFLLVGIVPLVGPALFFLWSAFALGYSFIAIPSGRMAHRFTERLSFARRHFGAVLGLGLVVAVVSLVPLVNVLFMPVFVVAGTLLYLDATNPSTSSTPLPPSGHADDLNQRA